MKIHVEVWIASKVVGAGGRAFSKEELLTFIKEQFGDTRRGLSTHISSYCVASTMANPGKFRYLTAVGRGTYRVYHPGDPVHSSKVSAPRHPDRKDVPKEYWHLLETDTSSEVGYRPKDSKTESPPPASRLLEDEEDVEKLVLSTLTRAFNGSGDEMRSRIHIASFGYMVQRQGKVSYRVGTVRISHKNDVLISDEAERPRVGIEVVFRSAVTDHFKSRSYDVMHMKQEFPDLKGVLVYVKSNTGIRPELAREISYAFDFFFSIPEEQAGNTKAWKPFLDTIVKWLGARTN